MFTFSSNTANSQNNESGWEFSGEEPISSNENYSSAQESESPRKNLLHQAYDTDIRPFIDIIDDLRACGLQEDVDLPSVVVLGDQSSGKSSILEAISGVELPRGSGIVTRCPLEIQMKKTDKGADWKGVISYDDMYGNIKKHTLYNSEEVNHYVVQAQNDIAGNDKMVSDKLITLRIESSDSPDLTLIDLPGITRLAVRGQPDDMPNQIRRLVTEYIERPNALILCVISGEIDIAVNECIKLAKAVDPSGHRILGVITKPDLIPKESKSEKMQLLQNELVHLTMGYTMVKCRSYDDIQNKISLENALENERNFFRNDSVFKHAGEDLLGTPSLTKKLTQQLVELIKQKIPQIMEHLQRKLTEAKQNFDKLPAAPPTDSGSKIGYYMTLSFGFLKEVQHCLIDGKIRSQQSNLFKEWRNFEHTCSNAIHQQSANFLRSSYTHSKLISRMKAYRGKELSRFINFDLFKEIVIENVKMYRQPIDQCQYAIRQSVLRNISKLVTQHYSSLPQLEKRIQTLCIQVLTKQTDRSKEIMDIHFDEEELVFTDDKTFGDELAIVEEKEKQELLRENTNYDERTGKSTLRMPSFVPTVPVDEDTKNAKEMHKLLCNYFKIIDRRIIDNSINCIRLFLRHKLMQALEVELPKLASHEKLCDLIVEAKQISSNRAHLLKRLCRLQEGYQKLYEFSEKGDLSPTRHDFKNDGDNDEYQED